MGANMKSCILLGLAIAAISGACNAAETARAVKPSEWRARPSGDMASRYYPDRAQRMEVGGQAVVDCRIGPEGKLEDCKVLSESPAEYGFGEAAIRLTKFMELAPPSEKDKRKGRMRRIIPVGFAVPRS